MIETHPAQDNESEAADWIASILGGSPYRRDIPPEQGKHDYDIVMSDGSTIALEITRHVSEADAEYTGITKNPNKRSWRSRGLVNDWSLAIATPDDGKQIHERLRQLQDETPALLEEMERTGEKVTYVRPHGPVSPLEARFRDLGVRALYCLGPAVSADGGEILSPRRLQYRKFRVAGALGRLNRSGGPIAAYSSTPVSSGYGRRPGPEG